MLSGLVLAGGRSTRMGRDKAQLRLPDGRTLAQRQIEVLRAAGAGVVNVAVGAGPDWTGAGVGSIRDEMADAGPLAGIAAGLRAAPAGLVLVLAVDMPEVSEAHLRQLAGLATASCGVVPVCGGQLEPLLAVYPADLAESASARLVSGQRAVHDWVRSEAALGRMRLWEAPAEWAGVLRSWNMPEDVPKA